MSFCHYDNCLGGPAKTSNKLPPSLKCLSAVFCDVNCPSAEITFAYNFTRFLNEENG